MKLNSSLKPGNYENKLIISVVSNPYTPKAIMTEGPDFNEKLKDLDTVPSEIWHFKKSTTAPAIYINAVNIEDEESDYEIKLWLDPADKTAYYYTEPEKVYLNTDMSGMFSYMFDLTTLDLSSFDTSYVTSMNSMFSDMSALTTLDLSNFDTSRVTNMSYMLYYMPNLTTLNLSSFDTSKVTEMNHMFSDMSDLTTLDLSNFNTSNVTDMGYMFSGMNNLTTLNLSSFDTSKVTEMKHMFSYMSDLTTLDLSNFDTSKVINMDSMFANMRNLTALDLSNFDTSRVTNMDRIFYLDDQDIPNDKLETIYVNNDFNTTDLVYFFEMFTNRKKLRGGNGSYLADPFAAYKTWLRVDRPGVQGYFTRKP